jgi:polyisoprenoid-binding protein YceI
MAVHAGRLHFGAPQFGAGQFGPGRGRIVLLTTRDGLAAQAGHDLTIEVTRWSAELDVADDLTPAGLSVRADMNSLVVREGTGGVKALTDRDRREIAATARKLLGTDRYPEAAFIASNFVPDEHGGGIVEGTLSINGSQRPLQLAVNKTGEAAYHATGTVRQSEFGIKPYTAFLGVLKVSDPVAISVDVELPEADNAAAGPHDQQQ